MARSHKILPVTVPRVATSGAKREAGAHFGKAGAAIGTQVFTPIRDAAGPSSTFYLLAGISIVGAGIYYMLPEGRDLDLAAEDESFKVYLRSEGYEGEL